MASTSSSPPVTLSSTLSLPRSCTSHTTNKVENLVEYSYIPESAQISESSYPFISPYQLYKRPSSFTRSIRTLISTRRPYPKEYIESSRLDQCALQATSAEQYVTLEIPSELLSNWKREGYTHLHLGGIRLILTLHGRKGLPVTARLAMLDTRFKQYQDAVIGTVLTTLHAGSVLLTFYPNFNLSLQDPNLPTTLKVQAQIQAVQTAQEDLPITGFNSEGYPVYPAKHNGHFLWDAPGSGMCDPTCPCWDDWEEDDDYVPRRKKKPKKKKPPISCHHYDLKPPQDPPPPPAPLPFYQKELKWIAKHCKSETPSPISLPTPPLTCMMFSSTSSDYSSSFPPLEPHTDSQRNVVSKPFIPSPITSTGHLEPPKPFESVLNCFRTDQIETKVDSIAAQMQQIHQNLQSRIGQLDSELRAMLAHRYNDPEFDQKEREIRRLKAELAQIESDKQKPTLFTTSPPIPSVGPTYHPFASMLSPIRQYDPSKLFGMTHTLFRDNPLPPPPKPKPKSKPQPRPVTFHQSSISIPGHQSSDSTPAPASPSVQPPTISQPPTQSKDKEPMHLFTAHTITHSSTTNDQTSDSNLAVSDSYTETDTESSASTSDSEKSYADITKILMAQPDQPTQGQTSHTKPYVDIPSDVEEEMPESSDTNQPSPTQAPTNPSSQKSSNGPWFTFDDLPSHKWRDRLTEMSAWIDLQMLRPGATTQSVLREFATRFTGALRDWFDSLGQYRQPRRSRKPYRFFRKKSSSSRDFKQRKSSRCFICKKKGHYAKDCPNKREKSIRLVEHLQATTDYSPENDELEFYFSEQDEPNNDTMFALQNSSDDSDSDQSQAIFHQQLLSLDTTIPIPSIKLQILPSKFQRPIPAIGLIDTGAQRSMLNPHILPPEYWTEYEEHFKAVNGKLFTTSLITKNPIGIQIFPNCVIWTKVICSTLPNKDLLLGFDIIHQIKHLQILPNGIRVKSMFKPFTYILKLYNLSETPQPYQDISNKLLSFCPKSHSEFTHPNPLWKNKDFIPHVDHYTHHLSALLKKKPPERNADHTNAVTTLKQIAQNPPPIKLITNGKHILQTDASDDSWGAILLEEINGKEYFIAYASGQFSDTQKHYHSVFKEILTVKNGIKKFEYHLIGHHFLIRMDSSTFPNILNFKVLYATKLVLPITPTLEHLLDPDKAPSLTWTLLEWFSPIPWWRKKLHQLSEIYNLERMPASEAPLFTSVFIIYRPYFQHPNTNLFWTQDQVYEWFTAPHPDVIDNEIQDVLHNYLCQLNHQLPPLKDIFHTSLGPQHDLLMIPTPSAISKPKSTGIIIKEERPDYTDFLYQDSQDPWEDFLPLSQHLQQFPQPSMNEPGSSSQPPQADTAIQPSKVDKATQTSPRPGYRRDCSYPPCHGPHCKHPKLSKTFFPTSNRDTDPDETESSSEDDYMNLRSP
ncbi:hypothetical protein KPL71_011894 [Citrus sinensis]|nr:hypothetical protein KPL71_011894 [Citrus sinensis]